MSAYYNNFLEKKYNNNVFNILFLWFILFSLSFICGAKFYQYTSSLEKLEERTYKECIETLPRNKDCKIKSIQYEIINKE